MNVRMIWPCTIKTFDTRADAGATLTGACLDVSGTELLIWSSLTFDGYEVVEGFRDEADGDVTSRKMFRHERGIPESIAAVSKRWEGHEWASIGEYLSILSHETGLLEFDVDGIMLFPLPVEEEDGLEG